MDRNSRGKIEVILRTFLAISILFIGISHPIKDSETLIRKMLNKYEGKWYKTLTFNQQTTRYDVEEILLVTKSGTRLCGFLINC